MCVGADDISGRVRFVQGESMSCHIDHSVCTVLLKWYADADLPSGCIQPQEKNYVRLKTSQEAVSTRCRCNEAWKSFVAFDKAALADGAIPKKYKELMAIAVALTTQCPYCIEIHVDAARKAGVTEEELSETAFVAAALRAGAAVTHATHLLKE